MSAELVQVSRSSLLHSQYECSALAYHSPSITLNCFPCVLTENQAWLTSSTGSLQRSPAVQGRESKKKGQRCNLSVAWSQYRNRRYNGTSMVNCSRSLQILRSPDKPTCTCIRTRSISRRYHKVMPVFLRSSPRIAREKHLLPSRWLLR